MVDWNRDEYHPNIVGVLGPGVRWRVNELVCCQKYFGLEADTSPDRVHANDVRKCGSQYVFWKIHTESTDETALRRCCSVADALPNVKHINDPRHWLPCHAKEKAFEIWQQQNIPCPDWFEFDSEAQFHAHRRQMFNYPMLLRINNSTGGWFSYLCGDDAQANAAIPKLCGHLSYCHDDIPNRGVGRKFIAVKYIQTTRPEKVNLSFRIIVAGQRLITGYARIGPAGDWIAITNRFEPWMEQPFLKYQHVCQEFCRTNEQLIVRAVRCLGLNFQGIDVILDQQDRPYFIEVQPGFSTGYLEHKRTHAPFYNPSRPPTLVNFLVQNRQRIRDELPLYDVWLDKYVMFDQAFAALKEDFDGHC